MGLGCTSNCLVSPENCSNITHCANSRAILLFRLLLSLDHFYITERKQEKSRARERERQPKPQSSGTGFGSNRYGGSLLIHRYHSIFPQTNPSQKLQSVARQRDEQLYSLFRGIGWILRNSNEPLLLNLMRISLLGHAVEELLRNDSISDCSERAGLYSVFLTALEAIATNPHLAEFYTSPRDQIQSTDGLAHIISGQGQLVKVKKDKSSGNDSSEDDDKAPPLLELMENLEKQAGTFYKTVGKATMKSTDGNVINSVNLCRSIIAVRQLLQATARRTGRLQSAPTAPQKSEGVNSYRLACVEVAYDEFPPSIHTPFGFTQHAQSLRSVNPRRTIILAKELGTMATSLPPGIFVRNAPNRPDCIKALIAGPEGTPYYGGLFEFDIFAPEQYPAVPPKVRINTTANGQVRFNPNLYAYSPYSI